MPRLCSINRCSRTAAHVLVFDAAGPGSEIIRIRAEVYACEQHREELNEQVNAHASITSDMITD